MTRGERVLSDGEHLRRLVIFLGATVAVGILAGIAGAATTLLLRAVEHLTYGYHFGTLLTGVSDASPLRRMLGPMIGGALAGLGWWLLRRRATVVKLDDAIEHGGRVPLLSTTADAALQVVVVGSGASLGREGAPRQFAAALSDFATRRLGFSAADQGILLACAAGAGLGAVYSVPLGGAMFAARILLHTWRPRAMGAALLTSGIAVTVASPITHEAAPLHWPEPSLSYALTAFALVVAPVAVGIGVAFNRIMAAARPAQEMTSWLIIPAIAGAGLLIGICSHWLPALPGNGKSILTVSLDGGMTLGSAALLLLLKPALTAVYLRAGAVGGMLTPSLATGAAMGSIVALAVNNFTHHHVSVPAVSLACAAGVLAVTQRAPVFAALFVWELARPPLWLFVVFATAALAAFWLWKVPWGRLLRQLGLRRQPDPLPGVGDDADRDST